MSVSLHIKCCLKRLRKFTSSHTQPVVRLSSTRVKCCVSDAAKRLGNKGASHDRRKVLLTILGSSDCMRLSTWLQFSCSISPTTGGTRDEPLTKPFHSHTAHPVRMRARQPPKPNMTQGKREVHRIVHKIFSSERGGSSQPYMRTGRSVGLWKGFV